MLLIMAGLGVGRFIASKARIDFRDPCEGFIITLGLGWGLLGLVMAILALANMWYSWVIGGVILCALIAFVMTIIANRPHYTQDNQQQKWGIYDTLLFLLFIILVCVNGLGSLAPETFYDALVYHLAMPDLYLRHQGFVVVPANIYSGMPGLIQMLYGLGLWLSDPIVAKLFHWAFGVMTAIAVFSFARRFSSQRIGIIAATAFYSMPLVGILSWKAAADLGCCYYQFLAAYAVCIRLQDSSRKWTVLCAVFTGLAMGMKYQSWPFAAIILSVLILSLRTTKAESTKEIKREVLVFISVCLAVMSVWPIKNVFLTGNPLYPFFRHLTPGSLNENLMRSFMNDAGSRSMTQLFTNGKALIDYLSHPWLATFKQPGDDNLIGPLFLIALPLLIAYPYRGALRTLSFIAAGGWLAWSFTTNLARYLLPILPLMCVLWAVGIEDGFQGWRKKIVYLLSGTLLGANLYWIHIWFFACGLVAAGSGLVNPELFLSREHPSYSHPYFSAAQFINRQLPPSARVLLIGEARGYYLEREYLASSFYDVSPLIGWIRRSHTPEQLQRTLLNEHVSHLLFNNPEFIRWGGINKWDLSAQESKLLYDFSVLYLRPIFVTTGTNSSPTPSNVIYEILAQPMDIPPSTPIADPFMLAFKNARI
jgi:hypothetical protein